MAEIKNEDLKKLVADANEIIHKDLRLKEFEGKLEVTESSGVAMETIKAIARLSISYTNMGIDRGGQEHLLSGIVGDVLTMFGDPRGVKPKEFKADSKNKGDKDNQENPETPSAKKKVKCPNCDHEFSL